jgi:hypothetical protein
VKRPAQPSLWADPGHPETPKHVAAGGRDHRQTERNLGRVLGGKSAKDQTDYLPFKAYFISDQNEEESAHDHDSVPYDRQG